MKLTQISLVLSSLLVLQACNSDIQHRESAPLTVSTYQVGEPEVNQIRKFNGQVMPAELTPLAFRLAGELKQVLVESGDNVTKDQVIAQLVDTKLQQELIDAKSSYELADKQLKRAKELYLSNMVSKAELDELNANFTLSKVNLKKASLDVEYTKLKAPFSGIVSDVDKKNFENIAPGETVLSIYDNSKVYVRVNVSDTVLAGFNPDIKSDRYKPLAHFSGQEEEFQLEYLEHTSELHPESKTYEFWLKMAQLAKPVLPGTSVTVYVDMAQAGLSEVRGFKVPMTTLEAGQKQGQFHVWKVAEGKALKTPVQVDQITGKGALVSLGLNQGDTLANSNLRKLREGMEINGAAQ